MYIYDYITNVTLQYVQLEKGEIILHLYTIYQNA